MSYHLSLYELQMCLECSSCAEKFQVSAAAELHRLDCQCFFYRELGTNIGCSKCVTNIIHMAMHCFYQVTVAL